jgi:hypothetical protein
MLGMLVLNVSVVEGTPVLYFFLNNDRKLKLEFEIKIYRLTIMLILQ